MRPSILTDPQPVLKSLLGLLTCVVLAAIVSNYPRYLPPDFTSDFLLGRADSFFGAYRWAFYAHLAAGPAAILLGLALLGDRLRNRSPAWHRRLGRVQMAVVLLGVTPSGLWMSASATTGAVAGLGFATLALATAACAALGWRAAVTRRFAAHRIWMTRLFALLFSAVVLRLMSGLAIVAGLHADWLYPASAWASWLVPLAAGEAWRVSQRARVSRWRHRSATGATRPEGRSVRPAGGPRRDHPRNCS